MSTITAIAASLSYDGCAVAAVTGAEVADPRRLVLRVTWLETPKLNSLGDRVRAALALVQDAPFIVDQTLVGAPSVAAVASAAQTMPIRVSIPQAGWNAVEPEEPPMRVPPLEVFGALRTVIDAGRLEVPAGLPLRDRLLEEIQNLDIEGRRVEVGGACARAVALGVWWAVTALGEPWDEPASDADLFEVEAREKEARRHRLGLGDGWKL